MPLDQVLAHVKQTAALHQIAEVIGWDQEAMMPRDGAPQRAEQTGALAAVIHQRESDPRLGDWLAEIDTADLTPAERCTVGEVQRTFERATKIPGKLAEELARAGSEGQQVWVAARSAQDFSQFVPALQHMIDLKRQQSACLSATGADPYDALLDEFEPGMATRELWPLLSDLRPSLTALRARIDDSRPVPQIVGEFSAEAQMALGRRVAEQLGYDFNAGRIDTVTHPFCTGIAGDVRITTRVSPTDPFDCLYSVIHEVGHALYAQGAPDPYLPWANYCSMGVHESQSRFWENQICRSAAFMEFLYPLMRETLGEFGCTSPDDLYRAANQVRTGFIRTEADEVHYNLHVLLRFELERELISGDLEVADLEGEWNRRFERDFGVAISNPADGVLQDVHWSIGAFGYFPTYSLGNIYAACLDQAMDAAMPGRSGMISSGEVTPILEWLRQNIHQHGRIFAAPELIKNATGVTPSSAPLGRYLEDKFTALYS